MRPRVITNFSGSLWMREKRIRGQEKSQPLFEYNLDTFDPDEPFTLDFSEFSSGASSKYIASAKKQAAGYANVSRLLKNIIQDSLIPEPISKDDPLNPEYFIGHHRRMEREERRMQLLERQQLIIAAAKVKLQMENLQRTDWRNHIGRIVKIDNIDDYDEVKRKRELALNEMATFLEKLEENGKRTNRKDNSNKPEKKKKKNLSKRPTAQPTQRPKFSLPTYEEFVDPPCKKPMLSLRPPAFGGMLPKRPFPPIEYQLPPFMKLEVQSFDLVERLAKQRAKLDISKEQ